MWKTPLRQGQRENFTTTPHTQITYVVSGVFEFNIDGEIKTVKAGDTMLKLNGVEHGCVCKERGILLDIFNPMREDFV